MQAAKSAACIKIKLRLNIRNRCGCVTPSGLHPKASCVIIYAINANKLLPRLASRSSCVIIYAADVNVFIMVACIKKTSCVFICSAYVKFVTPAARIEINLRLYKRNSCGSITPRGWHLKDTMRLSILNICEMCYSRGLHQDQAASLYTPLMWMCCSQRLA